MLDGFPPRAAPSAQWEDGGADKVIYLHLSSCRNGWHIHLSPKLHHLTAVALPTPSQTPLRTPPTGEEARERKEMDMRVKERRKELEVEKQTNQQVTSAPHLVVKVCVINMKLCAEKRPSRSLMLFGTVFRVYVD